MHAINLNLKILPHGDVNSNINSFNNKFKIQLAKILIIVIMLCVLEIKFWVKLIFLNVVV